MAQVLTNNTGLAYARESSLGVLPGSPDWKVLEPNSFGTFGAQITTVARSPISKLRQRRKGTVVDLDASAEYDADQTIDSLVDFTEAFLFANAVNADLTFRAADAQIGPAGFTIPAATSAQAAKLQYTAAGPISLLYSAGYATTGNNSAGTVFPLAADVALTDTVIEVTGITTETAPANAEVSLAGIRAEAGDLALAVSGNIGTLTSNNGTPATPIDFTTLGLTVGQFIHIGGLDLTANRFGSTAAGDGTRSFGEARIRTIAAQTLTLDKLGPLLVASDGTNDGIAGTEVPVDILFGRFVRNVTVDDADYAAISHHFEGSYPNLYETEPPTPVASPDGFEYVTGALANQMTWNMPLTDKSSATFAFVGIDAEEPVDNASRKSGASTPRLPLFTGAFNTSADFFRLGIADVDDTGLTSDFKDMTATFNNNVAPEKVLGNLGARYMNNGNFEVDIETSALFTNPAVAARVRANTTVTMAWLLRNDDGAVAVDVPSAIVGSDGKEFPVNETVRINLAVQAFVDPLFNTSLGVSFFPIYPSA